MFIFLRRLQKHKWKCSTALLPVFAADTDLAVRIGGQDPLLGSVGRWRRGTCDRIAAGRRRADAPALKARRAPARCISQKRWSRDAVTPTGTGENSGDLCTAAAEQGTCASLVWRTCWDVLGHPSHQILLPGSPPALTLRERLYSCITEALPGLSQPFSSISSTEAPLTPRLLHCVAVTLLTGRAAGTRGCYQRRRRCCQEAACSYSGAEKCCGTLLGGHRRTRRDEAGRRSGC